MTQTALTIVGYAVGAYFGYPQLGAIVGAYVGAQVAQKDIVGPRINDTTQQQSSYGAAIPKTYGGNRIAGCLIWAGKMQNVEHSESGKGGPSIETYTAVRSFAILVGEGPVIAIRRIWADTKLILDHSDAADSAAQMQSAKTAAMMAFYPGDELQMPDPTIEAVEGAGNVEPYRGSSYVVFTDFPLTEYGNRIPVFTFELSTFPNAYAASDVLEPLVIYPWTETSPPVQSIGSTNWHNAVPAFGGGNSLSFGDAAQITAAAGAASGDVWSNSAGWSTQYFDIYTDSANPVYNIEPTGANARGDDAQYVYARIAARKQERFRIVLPAASTGDDWWDLLTPGVYTWANYGVLSTGEAIVYLHEPYSVFGDAPLPPATGFYTTYAAGPLGGGMSFLVRGNPVLQVRGERLPTHADWTCYPGDPCATSTGLAEVPGDPTYCVSCDGEFTPNYPWTIITGTAKQLAGIEYRSGALYQNGHGPVLLPGDAHYSDAAWWADQRTAAIAAGTLRADVTSPVVVSSYAQRGDATLITVPEGTADLADIVLDICLATRQLTADQVDVSALQHREVLGFTRARRAPARSILQPLLTAYFVDAVEDGDVIRFVPRGGLPVATLTADDLAAGIDTADGEAIESDRAQEEELPSGVDVLYISRTVDYQSAVQSARRRVGGSTEQNGTELAVVLHDAHAAQIAEVLLFLSWLGRTRRTIKTWRGLTGIQPTDPLRIAYKGRLYVVRTENSSEQDGILTLIGVDEDQDAYRSVVAGVPPSGGGSAIIVVGPTRTMLLDIPLLRQDDDGPGIYLAATGYRPEWRGARVYRSTDGGISYGTFQDVKRPAIMGHAETRLGGWAGGNRVDESNTLDVEVLGAGTLSSITRAQLLNQGNAFALGDPATRRWEIAQFQRAVLIAPRTYRLSGLLRGRRGTERFTDNHTAADVFVLLDATRVYRPGFELSNVGIELLYRAISFGDIAGGDGLPFTNTAVGLLPLSPIQLAIGPRHGGGYDVKWRRRTRYPSPIVDSVGAPLAEASEQYRVRVLDGDAVVETQTVTTPRAVLGSPAVDPGFAIQQQTDSNGPFRNALLVDGAIYGERLNLAINSQQYVGRFDPATLGLLATSPALGHGIQWIVASATDLYVMWYAVDTSMVPTPFTRRTISRFALPDITVAAAERDANLFTDDWNGMVFDGTDLWITNAIDAGELLKLDPMTLATVDTVSVPFIERLWLDADTRQLWFTAHPGAGIDLVQWDIDSATEIERTNFTTFGIINLHVISDAGLLLLDIGGGFGDSTTKVYSFTPSGGALAHVRDLTHTGGPYARWGDFVAASVTASSVGNQAIALIDAATGDLSLTGDVIDASWAATVAGVNGANLLVWGSPINWYLNNKTLGVIATSAVSGSDYSGMQLEVCQISAAVGAGLPAIITFPGGSES